MIPPLDATYCDLPPTRGWPECHLHWWPLVDELADARLLIVRRGKRSKYECCSYLMALDPDSAGWLLVPDHSPDGEVYLADTSHCTCPAGRSGKACKHVAAMRALTECGAI